MEDIYLKHPITLGERTVSTLHFEDPTVMHLMRTDGHDISSIGADIALLSALTGEPEAILKRMHIEDWPVVRYELKKIYAVFFGVQTALTDAEHENENPPKAAD